MIKFARIIAAAALLLVTTAAEAGWKPVFKTVTYSISGRTGAELYESIGELGPKLGPTRAIAYTDFKLTWRRDYRPQADGSCKLVSATPNLVITTKLPKPQNRLPEPAASRWKAFIEGIEAHERVHADHIIEMVEKIVAVSVGFTRASDPKCKKIYGDLTKHLAELSQEQRSRSREFDRDEMSDGGNVHRLVLALVGR